jgi:glycine/betaine/sarcosine/D-proline reductase family selenoprotein B
VLAKEIERAGIPTVQVTAMTSIALMIGVPRVVQGTKIVNPMGNEEMTPEAEKLLRRDITISALNALQADPTQPTLFSRHQA